MSDAIYCLKGTLKIQNTFLSIALLLGADKHLQKRKLNTNRSLEFKLYYRKPKKTLTDNYNYRILKNFVSKQK